MTAVCPGGGPSGPLPGTPAYVQDAANSIEGALALLGFEEAAAVAALLAPVAQFTTAAFCAADPQPDPGITAQDVFNALLFAVPSISVPAQAKILQWWQHVSWYRLCGCIGTQTPAPSPPSIPSGTIGNSTGLPTNAMSGPCWNTSVSFWGNEGQTTPTTPPISGELTGLTPGGNSFVLGTGGPPYTLADGHAYFIPPGTTNAKFGFSLDALPSGTGQVTGSIGFYNAGGGVVTPGLQINIHSTDASPSAGPFSLPIPSTAVYWRGIWANLAPEGHQMTASLSFDCSQPGMVQPCCPPDPILETLLKLSIQKEDQILALLGTTGGTTLTGYTHGAVHGPFTGSGQFALTGTALGLLVNVTATSAAQGVEAGSPDRWFNLGWITPEIVSVPYAPQRIVYLTQQMQLPQLVDVINYTLGPGVHATVTELISVPAGALAQT